MPSTCARKAASLVPGRLSLESLAFRMLVDRKGPVADLGYDAFCQGVDGNKLGPLAVQGRQASLTRVVDEGHAREVHAKHWPAVTGKAALPAFLQYPDPRPY